MADALLAQSAAYKLVLDVESYRRRQKPEATRLDPTTSAIIPSPTLIGSLTGPLQLAKAGRSPLASDKAVLVSAGRQVRLETDDLAARRA